MMANFSASSNDSLIFPPNSFTDSVPLSTMACFVSKSNSVIFCVFSILKILILLPLCIFILHHGLQQWRQSRSTSSAAPSHSESFTYHMVTMEIFGISGNFLTFFAICVNQSIMFTVGFFLLSFSYFGEMFFHILTCLERYLAVVHPITYLSLRKERGIRIRNICVLFVWLFSALGLLLLKQNNESFSRGLNFFILVVSLIIISICSVSVLCVLIRPGPGDQGGAREKVDQSKQRAFHTIVAILGVLILRFIWDLVSAALYIFVGRFNCVMVTWSFWVSITTSLVLPVLFLLRKKKLRGKYICCKRHGN